MKLSKGDVYHFFLKLPVKLYLKAKFNIQDEKNPLKDIDEPYLLLGHHVTAFDPIISNILSKRLIRYIAADANYDSILKKTLLKQLECIPFSKNRADGNSIRKLLKHIKMGHPVGLYPEGGRNWDGSTDMIIPSTAKLIKLLKVPVYAIFYKGGYLSKPRWASHFRKGKIDLEIKKIFSKETIAEKSTKELYELLVDKLNYNEYEWQKNENIPFKGKKLAEDIERLLYICPDCHEINSLESSGDHFHCNSCNEKYTINQFGHIEGCSKFTETVSWNRWQKGLLPSIIKKGFTYSNHQLSLEKIEGNKRSRELVSLTFYPMKILLEYENQEKELIAIDEISNLSITFLDVVEFFINGTKYRLTFNPKTHMSVMLFFDLLRLLKEGLENGFRLGSSN